MILKKRDMRQCRQEVWKKRQEIETGLAGDTGGVGLISIRKEIVLRYFVFLKRKLVVVSSTLDHLLICPEYLEQTNRMGLHLDVTRHCFMPPPPPPLKGVRLLIPGLP